MEDQICKEISSLLKSNLDLTPANKTETWKKLECEDYIKLFAYIIIFCCGLFGNVSVILTVAFNRSMRTTINLYITNLAVADFLICIFCMIPYSISIAFTEDADYPLGAFLCKFAPFTQVICLTSSVLMLSTISCDRFIAVKFPMYVRITKNHSSVVMAVIWIISILVSIPFLIFREHKLTNSGKTVCDESWPEEDYFDTSMGICQVRKPLRVTYYVFITIMFFFVPLVIMITTYTSIMWKMWKAKIPGEKSEANVNILSRKRKKIHKMVFVVLVTFIICWTPFQILTLYGIFHNPAKHGRVPKWMTPFTWFSYFIAYANSFINPLIYGGFNKSFREGFFIILRCKNRRNMSGSVGSKLTFMTRLKSSLIRRSSKLQNSSKKIPQQPDEEMKPMHTTAKEKIAPSVQDSSFLNELK